MRVAPPVTLDKTQRNTLQQWARSRSLPARQIERARVVLLAADGKTDLEIAATLNISNHKAARWRKRFLQLNLTGLVKDAPRPGRKPAISARVKEELIRRTTQSKPANATHWSTRTMAAEIGVSEATVRRIWHAHGLKPHLVESFKISKDKHFAEKLEDIVGLYLNPPEHAIVMCVDEKSQIQALDRMSRFSVKWRSNVPPLVSVPPLRGEDFQGIRVYRSDVCWEERERRTPALDIVSISLPSYPSAWLHPCRARFRFTWQSHCSSPAHAACCRRVCRC